MDDLTRWTLLAQQLMTIQRAVGAALIVVQEKLDSAKGQDTTHVPASAVKTFGGKEYLVGNSSPLPKE